jgi:hypothetical protein
MTYEDWFVPSLSSFFTKLANDFMSPELTVKLLASFLLGLALPEATLFPIFYYQNYYFYYYGEDINCRNNNPQKLKHKKQPTILINILLGYFILIGCSTEMAIYIIIVI